MSAEPAMPSTASRPAARKPWRLAHDNPFNWGRAAYVRDLIVHLVRLELRLLYKRSKLGVLWTLLNPVIQLIIFTVVFQRLLRVEVPFYPLFLFCGLLCWNAFSESLSKAAASIVNSRNVLYQPGFRPFLVPVVVVLVGLVQFALSLSVLFALLVWYQVLPGWPFVTLPLIACVQALLTLALALPLAALSVRFDDVKHLLSVALRFLFFLSPVLYAADAFPGMYQWLFAVNPLTHLIEAYRAIILENRWPDWIALSGVAAGSVVVLLPGFWFFQSHRFRFIEEI